MRFFRTGINLNRYFIILRTKIVTGTYLFLFLSTRTEKSLREILIPTLRIRIRVDRQYQDRMCHAPTYYRER